jgi:hypothetical protein
VNKPQDDSEQAWHHDATPHEERPTPYAHAHAHAHEEREPSHIGGSFPHEKLDAYRVAVEMARLARKLAEQVPRGHRNLSNRRGAGEKRQRFAESRGGCGEVGATGDLLLAFEIGAPTDAEALKRLASRVSAMLTRLIARLDGMRP